jgi:hypothetical protein
VLSARKETIWREGGGEGEKHERLTMAWRSGVDLEVVPRDHGEKGSRHWICKVG